MNQLVEITLRLTLWVDAGWSEDDIVSYVRTQLPHAFGESLTAVLNPVDILALRQKPNSTGRRICDGE